METRNYLVFITLMVIAAQFVDADQYTIFETNMRKSHNEYRELHDTDPLVLDEKLSKYANKVAKRLVNNKKIKLNDDFGMNILWATGSSTATAYLVVKKVVYTWYNEVSNYKYLEEPEKISDIEHFTQIVWMNTKMLGVAVASAKGRSLFIAVYSPKGNIPGQFKSNVLSPQKV